MEENDLFAVNEQLSLINGALAALPGAGMVFGSKVGGNIEEMVSKVRQGIIGKLDQIEYLDTQLISGQGSFLSTDVPDFWGRSRTLIKLDQT